MWTAVERGIDVYRRVTRCNPCNGADGHAHAGSAVDVCTMDCRVSCVVGFLRINSAICTGGPFDIEIAKVMHRDCVVAISDNYFFSWPCHGRAGVRAGGTDMYMCAGACVGREPECVPQDR